MGKPRSRTFAASELRQVLRLRSYPFPVCGLDKDAGAREICARVSGGAHAIPNRRNLSRTNSGPNRGLSPRPGEDVEGRAQAGKSDNAPLRVAARVGQEEEAVAR